MKVNITIFNYQRLDMLRNIVKEIEAYPDFKYKILDDGSDYYLRNPNFLRFNHAGKPGFHKLWHYALTQLKATDDDLYIFLPNDFSQINFDKIMRLHTNYAFRPYAYNIIFDGRLTCWNLKRPEVIDTDTIKVGFTDCGFFCNRKMLETIGFYMNKIDNRRFEANDTISSGVGQQLTQRMNKSGVSIYLPTKSLAYHGDHDSLMHYEGRKKTPLISR